MRRVVLAVVAVAALASAHLGHAASLGGITSTQLSAYTIAGTPILPSAPRYLKTDGPGDRTSSAVLPLDTVAPTVAVLPNYDTDRDDFDGLLIVRGGTETSTDLTQQQVWSQAVATTTTFSGTARLTVWSALANFELNRPGFFSAFLFDCDATGASCVRFATGTAERNRWHVTQPPSWIESVIDMGTVSRTVAAGRTLRIKIVVAGSSAADMRFAYDTTAYPSQLTIN